MYNDASKLNNELNDFSLDSYANYDDYVNLYGPIGIGAGIILPILCLAVLWPLHQRKTIPSWPATTAIVFAIVASLLLWILSTAFIPATVAYSDACNSIDTVVKRVADEPSLTFYIDCNPTINAVFGDFQTSLNDAKTDALAAKTSIETIDPTCTGPDLSGLATTLDNVIAKIDSEATPLLSCGELNTLYTNSKGIVCGDETYTVVLHLHQAFIGKSRRPQCLIGVSDTPQPRRICICVALLGIPYCDRIVRVQGGAQQRRAIYLTFKGSELHAVWRGAHCRLHLSRGNM